MKNVVDIFLVLLLIFFICIVFSGSVHAEEMRIFVDDVDREIVLPVDIHAVSPSGPLAQIVLYSLDPDLFTSVSSPFDSIAMKYIDSRLLLLPVTGQFYCSKASSMNAESIMELDKKLHIDVVLDIGEVKETVRPDLDSFQSKTNVAFAFITQNKLSDISGSYLKLGELFNRKELGERLAHYLSLLLSEFDMGMQTIGNCKKSLIYVTAVNGNSVSLVGNHSYHAEVIDFVGNNIVAPMISSSGTGDGYTMEDILQMDPEFIIVSYTEDHAYYKKIMGDLMWRSLTAVQNGNVYEAPYGPYNWMGSPPSVHRLLSLIWLGNLMYPDVFDYDLNDRVKEFYSLFFHYNLTDAELLDLMIYAKPSTSFIPVPPKTSVSQFSVLVGLVIVVVFLGWKRRRSVLKKVQSTV
ncbi:MAG TPA: ABC transporter substrate-binding protein [Methanocorpusculum sp.]|nr:ABC transporter substrate-binding protein [Methanocorpusculum sp.]